MDRKKMDSILVDLGWWDGLPDLARQSFLAKRMDELDDDETYLALASVEFDTEMIEGTGPGSELFSYYTLIEHFAAGSFGLFAPTDIVDSFDEAAETFTFGFSSQGERFEATVAANADWVDQQVLILVNEALAAKGCERRFIPLPVLDQVIYAALTTEDLISAASSSGVIPDFEELS